MMNEQVKDPVCGMMVKLETAAAKTDYQDKTYYFCSNGCKAAFAKEPEKYLQSQNDQAGHHHHH
ncbi:MAG: YHS domain-containing protein [Anaerolineae bacterium]|nr:YHS domain-containing protein [Anaerolineae bacterium]